MDKKVRLNIDDIPENLYKALYKEFKRQHGNKYFDEWNITAIVEETKNERKN